MRPIISGAAAAIKRMIKSSKAKRNDL